MREHTRVVVVVLVVPQNIHVMHIFGLNHIFYALELRVRILRTRLAKLILIT